MLVFFFFFQQVDKNTEQTNHRIYQTDTHGILGGLKATKLHLRLLQTAFLGKHGFTGEPVTHTNGDNTALLGRARTDSPATDASLIFS